MRWPRGSPLLLIAALLPWQAVAGTTGGVTGRVDGRAATHRSPACSWSRSRRRKRGLHDRRERTRSDSSRSRPDTYTLSFSKERLRPGDAARTSPSSPTRCRTRRSR